MAERAQRVLAVLPPRTAFVMRRGSGAYRVSCATRSLDAYVHD